MLLELDAMEMPSSKETAYTCAYVGLDSGI